MNDLHLRLPATSANLGPGFDALGLALDLWLDIEASLAVHFSIAAGGRSPELVGALDRNLILDTYRSLAPHAPPLALRIENQIPLGMGCGSSAAALLAGVLLANHFGALQLTHQQVLDEACRREGHPDNVAACLLGGLTASAVLDGSVVATSLGRDLPWQLSLALPADPVPTSVARNCLPAAYSRADAVQNIQATALLMAAFACNRPELLSAGTRDRLHQPYRRALFPLFDKISAIPGDLLARAGVYAVTLSGAGPALLLFSSASAPAGVIRALCDAHAEQLPFEWVTTAIAGAAQVIVR